MLLYLSAIVFVCTLVAQPCKRWLIILRWHLSPRAQVRSCQQTWQKQDTKSHFSVTTQAPVESCLVVRLRCLKTKTVSKTNALLSPTHTHTDRDAHTFLIQRVERSVTEAEHWTDACSTPTCSGTHGYRRMLCWHERLMCSETKTADRWLINSPHCRVHCRQPDMPASQLINFWCSQTQWHLLCSPCDTCQMNTEEENSNIHGVLFFFLEPSSEIVLDYYPSSCAPLPSCC